MSPHGEMFRGQNVQLDHVRGVCMWLQAIYVGGFGSRSHQGSTHLDYFRSVTSLRERVRLSSTTPPSAVSDGAGSGSWRSWPGRASACWPGLPRMRTRRSSARLALCSSCWSLRWEPDCWTSPGPSRRPEEWAPPSQWSWWVVVNEMLRLWSQLEKFNKLCVYTCKYLSRWRVCLRLLVESGPLALTGVKEAHFFHRGALMKLLV